LAQGTFLKIKVSKEHQGCEGEQAKPTLDQ